MKRELEGEKANTAAKRMKPLEGMLKTLPTELIVLVLKAIYSQECERFPAL